MVEMIRHGSAVWKGDLRSGRGTMSTESKVLVDVPYSFVTRFENEPGTNPEELIAAAQAACYAMALANTLAKKGYDPQSVEVTAACVLDKRETGPVISRMMIRVQGVVPNLDEETFREVAREGERNCPVANLLRPGLTIELKAELKKEAAAGR